MASDLETNVPFKINYSSNCLNSVNNSTLKIFYINIQSIRNIFDEFKIFISNLKSDFDIIAISESWIKEHEQIFYNFEGYSSFHSCRSSSSYGGGVSVFVKSYLNPNL